MVASQRSSRPAPAHSTSALPGLTPGMPGMGGNQGLKDELRGMTFEEGERLLSPDGAAPGAPSLEGQDVPPATSGDIVGLKRGDGIDFGTEHEQPRVMDLQTRLNDCMLAELVIDGMFGEKTGRALREFQESIRQPQQEVVDPITANALNGIAPPGSAAPGTAGPQPDAAQLAEAASFIGGAETSARTGGQSLMQLGAYMVPNQRFAGPEIVTAGMHLTVSASAYASVAAELLAASTALTPGGDGAIGNPLVGVEYNDGLIYGTFDRRTRVRLLQEKLNEKTGAGLAVDGMFGDRTLDALNTFQTSVATPPSPRVNADIADLLMDRDNGGGATPGGSDALAMHSAGQGFVASASGLRMAAQAFADGSFAFAQDEVGTMDASIQQAALNTSGYHHGVAAMLDGAAAAFASMTTGPVGMLARAHVRKAGIELTALANAHKDASSNLGTAAGLYLPPPLAGSTGTAALANASAGFVTSGAIGLPQASSSMQLPE